MFGFLKFIYKKRRLLTLKYLVFSWIGRYDYLEFTDSRGGKVRYDMKVGSEKWPKVSYEFVSDIDRFLKFAYNCAN